MQQRSWLNVRHRHQVRGPAGSGLPVPAANGRKLATQTCFLALVLAAGLISSACSRASLASSTVSPGSTAPIPVKYGQSGTGGGQIVLQLIDQKNGWLDEGLSGKGTLFKGNPEAAAALIAGDIDFIAAGASGAVAAALKGADVRVIGVYQNKFEYHFIAAKGVRSVMDLKGRAIGIDRFGSGADFGTRETLRRLGLDAKEVTIIQIGNSVDRVAALQSNAIQAAMMSPEFAVGLKANGYSDLADMSKMDITYAFTGVATTKSLLEKRPDVADRYLRAVYRGIKMFRDDPEASQQLIAKATDQHDPQVLQELWETYRSPFSTDLLPDASTFGPILSELASSDPAAKNATPEQYLDLGPAQRVNASGFPRQLFG